MASNKVNEIETVNVAIDLGYENIKAKIGTSNGEKQILLPTLISDGSKDKIGSWDRYNKSAVEVAPIDNIDNMILSVKNFTPSPTAIATDKETDGSYESFEAFDSSQDGEVIKYFGNKAKEGNNISSAFQMNARYRNSDVLLMLHATLELLLEPSKDYEVYLTVGLPVNHFFNQKDMTKDAILNSNVDFEWEVGGFAEKRRPQYVIADVLVLPQGASAIEMLLNNHSGQSKVHDKIASLQDGDFVGIIDIGKGTTDLSGVQVFLNDKKKWSTKFIDTLTDGFDKGMNEVEEQLKTLFYEKTSGKTPTDKNIEDIFNTGVARVSGENVNMNKELQRAKESASRVIITEFSSKWRSRMNDFALFIFIGGGSVAFEKYIISQMSDYVNIIYIPEEAIFTNVNAFYRMGKKVFKKQILQNMQNPRAKKDTVQLV